MEDLEKFLFANDSLDGNLDKQSGPAMLETMIIFLESMKMTGAAYSETYEQTNNQLSYLEQRIAGLRKRFAKLPPPNTG